MPAKKKNKTGIFGLLHDRTVIIVAMLCFTMIVMTSLLLGVNLNADVLGIKISTERIKNRVENLLMAGDDQKKKELFELLKNNEVADAGGTAPSSLKELSFEEFKAATANVSAEDIKVEPVTAQNGEQRVNVQIGQQFKVTTTDRWNLNADDNENQSTP